MRLKNIKVLVTGADGFIGSHLVEELILEGADVVAFVYYNSFNTWGWLDNLSDFDKAKITVISGDIRDPNGVRLAMLGCQIVYHLAALIAIPFSYNSPDSYIDTNIKGTLNILQAAKDLNLEKIIITSTSEVYGTAIYVPIDEKHPKQPQSPYSASKIGADSLALSFYNSFNTPVIIVRPFNTFGPRQSARAIIPTLITQLLNGNKILKVGDISPRRDLLYVKDTVSGFIEISLTSNLIGKECNIATGYEISVKNLIFKISELLNVHVEIVQDEIRLRPQKSEVYRLCGSNELILKMTNWKPKYDLELGLIETIKWFRESKNLIKYKSNIYNI
jgi:NAD dependent epimerase/dehydratase